MLKTLEIAWLCITVVTCMIAVFQFFRDGWQSSLWMIGVSTFAVVMFSVRRRQRIRFEHKNQDMMKYH